MGSGWSGMSLRQGLGTGLAVAAIASIAFAACSYESNALFVGDSGVSSSSGGGQGASSSGLLGDAEPLPPRVIPGNAPDHCRDGEKSADESDVDCGGSECATCAPQKTCNGPGDCFSKICANGVCTQAALNDGVQNSVESGVDCGGEAYAQPCPAGQGCRRDSDCQTGVCRGEICQTPSATDGMKNGGETDIDCGGLDGTVPRCALGKLCNQPADCESTACAASTPPVCAPPSAANNTLDNGESDIDCGGADATVPRCGTNKSCDGPGDCASGVCSPANVCQPATGTDGVKNGDESDVDCGKATTGAPRCPLGKACRTREDCAAGGCGLDKLCTDTPSCARPAGGNSCGPTESSGADGGAGDAGNPQHESCCAEAALPSGAKLDKYLITAGRMRAMVDALGGNVRGFIQANPPAEWNPSWTERLPVIRADVDFQLGPWGYGEGCHVRYGGARTYDTDTLFVYGNGSADRSSIPRAQLDEKALNCMPLPLAAALCAYDGKKLASTAVLDEAHKLGGAWPWGGEAPSAERIAHDFGSGPSYTFPGGVPELTAHVAPPGRFPLGTSSTGHADVVGLLLPWVRDADPDRRVISSYSWTVDAADEAKALGYAFDASYVIGARCMR